MPRGEALVPADVVVHSGSVLVVQSMLAGESVPVDAEPGSKVYAGSLVRRGQAIAEVTATGSQTYFERAAELVRVARAASTEQVAIFAVTRNLAIVNGAVALLIVMAAYLMRLPSPDLIRLGLTALLATISAALPATFVRRMRRTIARCSRSFVDPTFGRARSCRYGRPVRRQDRDADAQYAGGCRRRSNDWIRP